MNLTKQTSTVEKKKLTTGIKLFTVAAALTLGLGLGTAKANATNYYVSTKGNNTTGTAWASAWNEMNQIKWANLKANDSIQIDKGTYFTTLTVPNTVPAGVTIYQSTAAGHSGLVEIDGTANKLAFGIDIRGPIQGLYGEGKFISSDHHELDFLIQSCTTAGVRVVPSLFKSTGTVVVQQISARFNPQGVIVDSATNNSTVIVSDCIIHDNPTAAVHAGTGVVVNVQYSWLFNLASPQSTASYNGIVAERANVTQCVIGPFLNYGLITTKPSTSAGAQGCQVNDCLFLDALKANVYMANPTPSSVAYSTLFSTPKNYYVVAHSNFVTPLASPGSILVGGSVIYGAGVSVPVGAGKLYPDPTKYPNYEYAVTGNTTALAAQQLDPQFADSSVYTLPNTVSEPTLEATSFKINRTMPNVQQVGTSIYSVPAYLAKFFPGQ